MKLIIAGSRTLQVDNEFIKSVILNLLPDEALTGMKIVSGCAKGIDKCGECFSLANKLDCEKFPADWDTHGKAAGPIRNKQMAEYADALLLIWDGESKGSRHMKETMLKLGKPVYEVVIRSYNV